MLSDGQSLDDVYREECQVCGRMIGFAAGVIAHHGYQRPHAGWQTGSCLGARHTSWKWSARQLEYVIELMIADVKRFKATKANMLAQPEPILTQAAHRDRLTYAQVPATYCKPDDTNYPGVLKFWISVQDQKIAQVLNEIKVATQRRDSWRPPLSFEFKPRGRA